MKHVNVNLSSFLRKRGAWLTLDLWSWDGTLLPPHINENVIAINVCHLLLRILSEFT